MFDDGLEFDLEPDYCFVVKKKRAAFFIEQLVELKLVVKEFPCKIKEVKVCSCNEQGKHNSSHLFF